VETHHRKPLELGDSVFGHFARAVPSTDYAPALHSLTPKDWKRPAGRPRTTRLCRLWNRLTDVRPAVNTVLVCLLAAGEPKTAVRGSNS